MNNQYIKQLSLEKVIELALPHLQKSGALPAELSAEQQEWAHDLIALYHGQLSYGAEIVELTAQFFKDDIEYNEQSQEVLAGDQVPEVMASLGSKLPNLRHLTHRQLKRRLELFKKKRVIKAVTYSCRFASSRLVKQVGLNYLQQSRLLEKKLQRDALPNTQNK